MIFRVIHLLRRAIGKLQRDGMVQCFIVVYNKIRNKRALKNINAYEARKNYKAFHKYSKLFYSNRGKYDVIFFSIIDWYSRYQRSQHLASGFAEHGHRVFYLNTSFSGKDQLRYKKIKENIYEIFLPYGITSNIYHENINNRLQSVQKKFDNLFDYFAIDCPMIFSEYPMWYPIINYLKNHHNAFITFDILDEFSGFESPHPELINFENKLINLANLNVATAKSLFRKARSIKPNTTLLANATEFDYFSLLPTNKLLEKIQKPIIGYYGAIAHWFDDEIIEYAARSRPNWNFVLIGHTVGSKTEYLKKYTNIYFLGEKPYVDLTKYLYWFDVCLIPFKLVEPVLSTNPVKFFEYISSGKPVVSTQLVELSPYKEIAYIAKNKKEFVSHIQTALQESNATLITKRMALAKQNTWENRFSQLYQKIKGTYSLASIVIVTYNNIAYTKLCIWSVLSQTAYPNYEIIIVDNASSDGTKTYLQGLIQIHKNIKVKFNKVNYGFAKANNMGMKLSSGDYLLLLNNDTIVTRGWLGNLIKHLEKPRIGVVGPVTNSIGNESRINFDYNNLKEMFIFADHYTRLHANEILEMFNLAMFCVALKRKTVNQIGFLDEDYGQGMYEDDDYSHRMRQANYKLICAEDVFVHHFGSISFSKLSTKTLDSLMQHNLKKFEKKWKTNWVPHKYRHGVFGAPKKLKLKHFQKISNF